MTRDPQGWQRVLVTVQPDERQVTIKASLFVSLDGVTTTLEEAG